MTSRPLILGSSSIWRKQVLIDMGYIFKTMSPDIDEKAIRDSDPKTLTLLISRAKAQALLKRIKESDDELDKKSIMICSDQVIVHNGVIREKPETEQQCREYLQSYEFHPAVAVVSVVVVNIETGKIVEGTDIATQHFKKISDEFIDKLIKQGDVMHCAGGFTVEHMADFTLQLEGEVETILGLPKTLTKNLISQVSQ
ncbi:maf family protein [Dictyostelium discoideum AX4]|uniref:7-methyl-GTP pyrophosphatase n=1 Tax=Dictyostelium discoideum TaxID=44689 RepID=NTPPB_DICDI|nr:maf family protein [Dictyostelium discoideum AX4]Q54TC5.1 RecName: Full=7-methyl-GTP pyrophosphatase; Short=m(7)GTP pyrophosphatase; AltName: Full=Maf-like protein DDB_G0281937 [Dictyostelium discoideum]EAL66528.1 maf family protein [Dictyostelium discoideum AX4]|eukprot:XP_640464.1 maf family protein [Dictyostelium discoideum AX4]